MALPSKDARVRAGKVLFASFLLGLSILGIMTFSPFDPSLFSNSFPQQEIANQAGYLGAQFAAVAIYTLGGAVVLIPLYLASVVLWLARQRDKKNSIWNHGAAWGLILTATAFLFQNHELQVSLPSIALTGGGQLGLAASHLLVGGLGEWGSYLGVAVLIALAILINPPSIREKKTFDNAKPNKKATSKTLVKKKKPPLQDPSKPSTTNSQQLSYQFQTSALGKFVQDRQDARTQQTGKTIVKTLQEFGIGGSITGTTIGPTVTIFDFLPDSGTKQARIQTISDDLALALQVDSLIIEAIPEKKALGIQVPNVTRRAVLFGDVAAETSDEATDHKLSIAMGISIWGSPVAIDLCSMPHLLIAGATGSGKSVAINTIICNLLDRYGPETVRMMFIDPKMLELSVYEGIPHLIAPVVTNSSAATSALAWCIAEMDRRYEQMQSAQVRSIEAYNQTLASQGQPAIPYIVLVVDELADLMLTAPKEVEVSIQRLAQKARASGIHMVVATQRPSVDVITGVIKANLPTRMAFQVVSKHDSRTILDQMGAEKLLGKGDMLFMKPGHIKLARLQCSFISDQEVVDFVQALKTKHGPHHYDPSIIAALVEKKGLEDTHNLQGEEEEDNRFAEATEIARSNGSISASFLQRQLKIGYNRAARIVELMEAKGMVSAADGVKPRKWIADSSIS